MKLIHHKNQPQKSKQFPPVSFHLFNFSASKQKSTKKKLKKNLRSEVRDFSLKLYQNEVIFTARPLRSDVVVVNYITG
jgi:hypothetical protein